MIRHREATVAAMREPVPGLRLGHAVADFLADLAHANRSAATIRAYRTDLASFTAYHRGPPESITPDVLRGYFATLADLAPATRARHEATLASLLRWAYRQELIAANPMDKLDRVRLPAPAPRGLGTGQVAAILVSLPRTATPRRRPRTQATGAAAIWSGHRRGERVSAQPGAWRGGRPQDGGGGAAWGRLFTVECDELPVWLRFGVAGMAAARGRGGVGGRPSLVITEKLAVARRMLSEGRGKAVIARTIGVSRPTLYAHLAAAVDVAEVVV